ncbi:uncharacterized protein DNG_08282 [Cephalotrichum gorgonifer]|uniref:GST N-terminal domain-containing protein n=1 Tax=Cephalotrichum gorgonifer TaxID=2041049 RepID=A0AAE8SY76_9PEZI|nr:uncharacterized protein DNG_08282 [Cephalotrichum gorgonifer]
MTYTLYIGNKRYSSWSMRPWVLLKVLNVPFEEKLHFLRPGLHESEFRGFSPSGKVPCLHDEATPVVVWDSLAICEYIAESHPAAWPADARARAFARSAAAEMHSGFNNIRNECGMNVGMRITVPSWSEGVKSDVRRLNELFKEGLETFGGPWLAGKEFTVADAMFAPIASRYKTYGLEVEGVAKEYFDRLFEHPVVQEWVRDGIRETARIPHYEADCRTEGRTYTEVTG